MWIDANPTTSNQGLNLVIVFFEKVFPLYLKQKKVHGSVTILYQVFEARPRTLLKSRLWKTCTAIWSECNTSKETKLSDTCIFWGRALCRSRLSVPLSIPELLYPSSTWLSFSVVHLPSSICLSVCSKCSQSCCSYCGHHLLSISTILTSC